MLSCTSVPSVSNTCDVSAVDYSDTDAWGDSQRNNVTSFNVQLNVQWTTNIEFHRLGIFLPWEWELIPTMWNLKQKFNNFIFGDLSCTEQRAIKVKLHLIVSTFDVLSCLTRRTNSVNSTWRILFIKNDMLLMSTDLIGYFMFIVKAKFDEIWPSFLWLANSQSWVNEKLNFVKVLQRPTTTKATASVTLLGSIHTWNLLRDCGINRNWNLNRRNVCTAYFWT